VKVVWLSLIKSCPGGWGYNLDLPSMCKVLGSIFSTKERERLGKKPPRENTKDLSQR
jgi:hypothetical protein